MALELATDPGGQLVTQYWAMFPQASPDGKQLYFTTDRYIYSDYTNRAKTFLKPGRLSGRQSCPRDRKFKVSRLRRAVEGNHQ